MLKQVVKVEEMIATSTSDNDALEQLAVDIESRGYGPSAVGLAANSRDEAVTWIRDTVPFGPLAEVVACRISRDFGDAKEPTPDRAAEDPTVETTRLLSRRHSDPVDMSDPEFRRKFQSIMQSSKQFGDDVAQYDAFS